MTASSSESRIRRLAGVMSWVTLILAALITAASIYFWSDWRALVPDALPEFTRIAPAAQASLLALVGLPSLGLMLWGLWNAFWLFRNLRAGALFVSGTGLRIRHVGIAILLSPFIGVVARTAETAITTWNSPPGEHQIAVTVGSAEVVMLVAGAMLLMLGWAMAKATSIAEENQQFV